MQGLPVPKRRVKQQRLKMISRNRPEFKMNRIKQMQDRFKKEYLKQKNKLDADRHRQGNRQQF